MAEKNPSPERQPPPPDAHTKQAITQNIKSLFTTHYGANGLALVVGTSNSAPQQMIEDYASICSVFENDLKLAVVSKRNLSCEQIVGLVKAAAELRYPVKYKFIIFYFAGYGGTDDDGHAFIRDEAENKLFIQEGIVSPFQPVNAKHLGERSRLFFFDCCTSVRQGVRNIPINLPKRPKTKVPDFGQCLVSYTGYEKESRWTQYFQEYVKTNASITDVLTRTYEQVDNDTDGKEVPIWESSIIGSVYLKVDLGASHIPPTQPPLQVHQQPKPQDSQPKNVSQPEKIKTDVDLHMPPTQPPLQVHQQPKLQDSQPKKVIQPEKITTDGVSGGSHKPLPKTTKPPQATPTDSVSGGSHKPLPKTQHQTKPSQATPTDSSGGNTIMNKSPEQDDVFKLLKSKSNSWDDIARELQVDLNKRDDLRKDVTFSNDRKLEEVLENWIDFETSPVTWNTIIEMQEELGLRKMMKDVKKYLQKKDVVEKYSDKDDYES